MHKIAILLVLTACAALFGQNPSFDYASYAPVDLDSLIKATPKAKLESGPKAANAKARAFDVLPLSKIRFTCTLASTPMQLDTGDFGKLGNIYMKSLKAIGVADPPSITNVLKIKTKRGRHFVIAMEDVLTGTLLQEGRDNGKIEIYGLHYMNDADGPVIVMSEFKML